MSDGFYDFNFKYSCGGFEKPIGRFMHMKITLSYSMKFNFDGWAIANNYLMGFINIVDVYRPNKSVTNMISYHRYICAN